MSQVQGQGDMSQVDETQVYYQPPRARQATPRYDAPRRRLPEKRLTREGYSPSQSHLGGNDWADRVPAAEAYGQADMRFSAAPKVAPSPRQRMTPAQSPRYAPEAMPRDAYGPASPYDRASRGGEVGSRILHVAAILARLLAFALVAIVIVLAVPSLGVRQYVLLPAAFLSRLLPPSLSGFLLLDMPFGGVFRTDLAIAATVLLVIDWFCTNLRLSR